MTEQEAIMKVLEGHHPTNMIPDAPLLGPPNYTTLADLKKWFHSIPLGWFKFRRLVRMWLVDEGYIDRAHSLIFS